MSGSSKHSPQSPPISTPDHANRYVQSHSRRQLHGCQAPKPDTQDIVPTTTHDVDPIATRKPSDRNTYITPSPALSCSEYPPDASGADEQPPPYSVAPSTSGSEFRSLQSDINGTCMTQTGDYVTVASGPTTVSQAPADHSTSAVPIDGGKGEH